MRVLTTLLIATQLAGWGVGAWADTLSIKTPRGAMVDVIAEFPAGAGPFTTVVLAPGGGYHMALPALEQTSRSLVAEGYGVLRFNWAYFSAQPKGNASDDLGLEVEDMQTVLRFARADARVNRQKLVAAGKSLGSLVAWRVLASDAEIAAALLLTPVCSRVPQGQTEPVPEAQDNYPGFAKELRPVALVLGNRDPLCATPVLYGFAAQAKGPVRVDVVGGDHGFEVKTLPPAAAESAKTRNINAVAQLAVNFVTDAVGP